MLEGSWQASQSTQQFLIYFLHAEIRNKEICICVIQEQSLGFLQYSGKSHWFSNKLRGLIFLISDPKAGVPAKWLYLLDPQARSLRLWWSPPLLGHPLGLGILIRSLLLPSYQISCGSFFKSSVVEDFRSFLARVVLCAVEFRCVQEERWAQGPSILSSWSHLPFIISLRWV